MRRDSLSRLIARSCGLADVLQPVLPSRFEPVGRPPLPRLDSFGMEQTESVGKPADAVSPADNPTRSLPPQATAPHVGTNLASGRETREDVKAPTQSRATTAYPPFRATQPAPGSHSSLDVSAGPRARDKGRAGQPPHPAGSPEPAPVDTAVVFVPVGPPSPHETRERAGKPLGRERKGAAVIPAEIRVSKPQPTGPKAEPGGDDPRRESSLREGSQERQVTVHIGRIEVRAVMASANEPERKRPVDNRQRLTLSDYLRQREKGTK